LFGGENPKEMQLGLANTECVSSQIVKGVARLARGVEIFECNILPEFSISGLAISSFGRPDKKSE
jgi:hypothetical protein